MGIDCINYDALLNLLKIKTLGDKTFTYLPRFLVLQLGAILQDALSGNSSNMNAQLTFSYNVKMQKGLRDFANSYLNQISIYSRMMLLQYYQDWVDKEFESIKNDLTSTSKKKNMFLYSEIAKRSVNII